MSPPMCSRTRQTVCKLVPRSSQGPNVRRGPVQELLALFVDVDKVAQRREGWARNSEARS